MKTLRGMRVVEVIVCHVNAPVPLISSICLQKIRIRMKLRSLLIAAASCLAPLFVTAADGAETFKYEVRSTHFPPLVQLIRAQSDISRLRSLVIHSLYSHKDVFLRELLSNANDALEKLRLTALTDRGVMSAGEANVTIEVRLDEGGATGQLVVRGTWYGTDDRS